VHEESISVADFVSNTRKRANLINPKVVASELEATDKGQSLALIRPTDVSLKYRKLSEAEISDARDAFEAQAKQASMFDATLDILEPCPFEFKMKFRDGDGKTREKRCADWETSAAFFNLSKKYEEHKVLEHLKQTYCQDYVDTGLVFALGNIAARPKTWQLLSIFPIPETSQGNLDL